MERYLRRAPRSAHISCSGGRPCPQPRVLAATVRVLLRAGAAPNFALVDSPTALDVAPWEAVTAQWWGSAGSGLLCCCCRRPLPHARSGPPQPYDPAIYPADGLRGPRRGAAGGERAGRRLADQLRITPLRRSATLVDQPAGGWVPPPRGDCCQSGWRWQRYVPWLWRLKGGSDTSKAVLRASFAEHKEPFANVPSFSEPSPRAQESGIRRLRARVHVRVCRPPSQAWMPSPPPGPTKHPSDMKQTPHDHTCGQKSTR